MQKGVYWSVLQCITVAPTPLQRCPWKGAKLDPTAQLATYRLHHRRPRGFSEWGHDVIRTQVSEPCERCATEQKNHHCMHSIRTMPLQSRSTPWFSVVGTATACPCAALLRPYSSTSDGAAPTSDCARQHTCIECDERCRTSIACMMSVFQAPLSRSCKPSWGQCKRLAVHARAATTHHERVAHDGPSASATRILHSTLELSALGQPHCFWWAAAVVARAYHSLGTQAGHKWSATHSDMGGG